jgi:hypothetical protein
MERRRTKVARRIRAFVEHPATNLVLGVGLFAAGFAETYVSFSEDLSKWRLGAHHGLLVLGLFNVLASVPDLIEGLDAGGKFLERLDGGKPGPPDRTEDGKAVPDAKAVKPEGGK